MFSYTTSEIRMQSLTGVMLFMLEANGFHRVTADDRGTDPPRVVFIDPNDLS